jgi:predicted ATPase
LYKHWRHQAGWQTEEQFSDGTLRLLGLLWVLLDGNHPLLLEEPELSLHPEVIRRLPAMMARIGRKAGRQVLVSTHSAELLTDEGIAPEEVLFLEVTPEDTKVHRASDDQQIRTLYEQQVPLAEAVLPRTAPKGVLQLSLFGD